MKPYPSRSRFIASVVSWSTLRIKLGNRLVGTITNVVTDKNIFAFDTQYVEDENRPVLSLSYYDIERQLIARPREGISPEQAFPLLWLVGADLPRSVIAEDSEGQALLPRRRSPKHAKRIKTRFCVFLSPGATQIFRDRQRKEATAHSGAGAGRPVDRETAVAEISPVPENEFAMMTLARGVGIDVPEFGLVPVSSIGNLPAEFADDKMKAHFVRRFDRGPDGERIHAEDWTRAIFRHRVGAPAS